MPVPMVGRDAALRELREAWACVKRTGRPVPAVITAPPGTGTRPLPAAAAPPDAITGRARLHTPAPYDWLASALAGHDLTGLDLPRDALRWLAQDPDVPRERYTPDALLLIA